jgi:spermidine synthase
LEALDNLGEAGNTTLGVSSRERATLLVSVLIISICALVYELIIATLSSYLLGDSVTQFSFTIGFFLFAMGIGALASRRIKNHEVRWFIVVEILTGIFGGIAAALLYAVFAVGEETYYYTAMIGITLAVGICIGLEIPLLTRIVAHRADLSKALADILSIDYLGALVGSLAFPLLLLPVLGVTQTAFAMGLFNILVAGLCLNLFRTRLDNRWRRRLTIAWGAALIFMIAGTLISTDFVRFFEQQLYTDVIIFRHQTPYQRIVITRDNEDVRLFLDGNLQLSSRDEYRYHEVLVHPVMSAARSHETVLILGGGDGAVAREVLKYDDIQHIVVVDLDHEVTELARTHPLLREINADSLDDPRVTVINGDAYRYLEESSDLFPVIIIDLPDPNNESLSKLYTQQFYTLVRQRLTPDGAFVTQAASPYFVRDAYWTIANTITASGFNIVPLHTYVPSFGEWGFVIGTPLRTPTLEVDEALVDSMRYLTSDVLQATLIFDPDIAHVETEINTLDNPVLVRYYEQGWLHWN